MRFALIILLCSLAPVLGTNRFVGITFHDVVETREQFDDDAVSVDQLIGFFEWLKGNQWTAISLGDVEAARSGKKELPERAILLTFDDGTRSHYTRVFPLLLAYKYPAVISLLGNVLDAPMEGQVEYGERQVPRKKFLSWDEIREMDASGLVEIASHSYDLHRAVQANPQGSTLPAALALKFRSGKGYETEEEFRARLREDLSKSRELLARHLGKAPRALAWPFGRYNEAGQRVALELAFEYLLTLDPEPAWVDDPHAIGRLLVSSRSSLGGLASELNFERPLPRSRRLVGLDPAKLWTENEGELNERLGKTIERLRALGSTAVVLEAGTVDEKGKLSSVWFPNRDIPMRADILSRIARQCQTRGGVQVYARLPVSAALSALGDPEKVVALFHELGTHLLLNGFFVDDCPSLARVESERGPAGTPWEIRAARTALIPHLEGQEKLELLAFGEIERSSPNLELIVVGTPSGLPSAIADLTLIAVPANARSVRRLTSQLEDLHWLESQNAKRGGLWLVGDKPPGNAELEASARIFQRRGGTVYGWSKDDPVNNRPNAQKVGRTVSAATFPVKL
jgi:biofilm PGA synthesis lipoprotein PgaB